MQLSLLNRREFRLRKPLPLLGGQDIELREHEDLADDYAGYRTERIERLSEVQTLTDSPAKRITKDTRNSMKQRCMLSPAAKPAG